MDTKSYANLAMVAGPNVFQIKTAAAGMEDVPDSADIFDEDAGLIKDRPVPGYNSMRYVPWGINNALPYRLLRTISGDEVLSQNLFFNVLAAYGAGLAYVDRDTGQPTADKEIDGFVFGNSLKEFFLEQATDMKHFFFSVAVVILSRDGNQIVQVRHKDACYCRFEKSDSKGRINHVFFANWRKPGTLSKKSVECLQLLDQRDPLGHLRVLMGKQPGADGLTKPRTTVRKFAVLMRFPTPGQRYYPIPYYTSIFRGDWYDIKRLIGKGKKSKIRNHAAVRYQVEVHRDYWESIIAEEGLTDELEIRKRIVREKENIRDFVTGVENSGKAWITGYYVDPNGNEQRMVRIHVVDTKKEGGDWAEDTQEASNMMCYGTNIHPNLVGATPGKSQTNNSGSDKRELFTLKQSLETAFHDQLLKVHELIIRYNGWHDKVKPSMPLIILTTLDKKTDAKKIQRDGSESDVND